MILILLRFNLIYNSRYISIQFMKQ